MTTPALSAWLAQGTLAERFVPRPTSATTTWNELPRQSSDLLEASYPHEWSSSLVEAKRILKPNGVLNLAGMVRKRNLPADVESQLPSFAWWLHGCPLRRELQPLLEKYGFTQIEIAPAPFDLNGLLPVFDEFAPMQCEPNQTISDEEWIASTQACCGLGSPRSEKLVDILRYDNVNDLWQLIVLHARRSDSSAD